MEFSRRDLYAIVLLSFLLVLISQPLFAVRSVGFKDGYMYILFSDGTSSYFYSPYLYQIILLVAASTIILHEIFHILTLWIFGIDFELKTIILFKLPIAIQVDYKEMEMWQYVLTALSPQMLTIILVSAAHFMKYHLGALLILSAILNFASSSGDFYGVVKTLIKAKCIRGKIFKVGELKYCIKKEYDDKV